MLWLLPLLLAGGLATPVAAGAAHSISPVNVPRDAPAVAPLPRVRSTNADVTALIRRGIRRSPTFSMLVAEVEKTDVIVYIERTPQLPRLLDGRLLLIGVAAGHRYLRIQVRPGLSASEEIALIGHELQHALEVAREPLVRDTAAMAALYKRIGTPSIGAKLSFDTLAAQNAGRSVRGELGS